jgi:hypothetical protein
MTNKDFTLSTYKQLLQKLKKNGYAFFTLEEYFISPIHPFIILRHDIDRKPENALKINI